MMRSMRLQGLLVLLLMVAAYAGAHAWRPTVRMADQRPKVELAHMFPTAFGVWREDLSLPPQLVSPDLQARLNVLYNQTLSRVYVDDKGRRVMLSVAYGGDQSDGTRAHIPEVCYPAQGFEVKDKVEDSIRLDDGRQLPLRRLVAVRATRVEPISYWLVIGEQVATSGAQVKWAQLRYSTMGMVPDGMLVRVSSIGADTAAAYAMHADFIRGLVASSTAVGTFRVAGAPATR